MDNDELTFIHLHVILANANIFLLMAEATGRTTALIASVLFLVSWVVVLIQYLITKWKEGKK